MVFPTAPQKVPADHYKALYSLALGHGLINKDKDLVKKVRDLKEEHGYKLADVEALFKGLE